MASVAKAKEEEQKHVAQVEANVLKTILPALRDLGSETAVQGFIEHLHEDLLAVEARMYPSQFHFTADCRELARRAAVDIERVWEEVFGSGGAHLAKPQHVELLARLLFAYISIAGAEGDPNTRVVAAIRRAPRDGECDGGLLVNDHLPLTVECKCVFVGESVCDDVPANSFVVRNAGAAIAATHSLFVVVWRDTVEPEAVFPTAASCLAAIRRVVFIDINELPRQEQDKSTLTAALDKLSETNAPGMVKVVCGAAPIEHAAGYGDRATVRQEGAKIRAWACDQAGRPEATGSSPHRVPQPPVKREVHAEAKEDDEEEGGC